MAINARTFQILYIIRERAVADLATTAKHVSAFIMARRKDAPAIYSRSYIAPGAVQQILNRMTTGEGLLTLEDNEYLFTAKGSLMADLLAELEVAQAVDEVVPAAHVVGGELSHPDSTTGMAGGER